MIIIIHDVSWRLRIALFTWIDWSSQKFNIHELNNKTYLADFSSVCHQREQCRHMCSGIHNASIEVLEGITEVNHASLLCVIGEAMKWYIKPHHVHITSILGYFSNYVLNGFMSSRVHRINGMNKHSSIHPQYLSLAETDRPPFWA